MEDNFCKPNWDSCDPEQHIEVDGIEIRIYDLFASMERFKDRKDRWPTDADLAELMHELVVSKALSDLEEDGLVDICIGEDGEPIIKMTKDGEKLGKSLLDNIDKKEQ